MEGRVTVTEMDLLQALRDAMPEVDDGAMTTEEIAGTLGVSIDTARRRIKPLLRTGQMRAVRKVITDIGGRAQPVTAYKAA